MKGKPPILASLLVLCAMIVSGCAAKAQPAAAPTATPGSQAGLPNPACVYCEEHGGKNETRTGADGGQYAVCIFSDGSECDAWAYFRGECAPGATNKVEPPATATLPASAEHVAIPEAGLALDIPQGWQRDEAKTCTNEANRQEWRWVPAGAGEQRFGVAWQDVKPGWEPESIFPGDRQSVVQGRTEGPELGWGQAATYRLQVMVPDENGKIQAVEEHVLVRTEKRLYDLYASAASEQDLAGLEPALQEMVASATPS